MQISTDSMVAKRGASAATTAAETPGSVLVPVKQQTGGAGARVEGREMRDELAAVRQFCTVTRCRQARLGDVIVLTLKRPGRMDDEPRTGAPQARVQIARAVIERPRGGRLGPRRDE
jgi:hypothetical protein